MCKKHVGSLSINFINHDLLTLFVNHAFIQQISWKFCHFALIFGWFKWERSKSLPCCLILAKLSMLPVVMLKFIDPNSRAEKKDVSFFDDKCNRLCTVDVCHSSIKNCHSSIKNNQINVNNYKCVTHLQTSYTNDVTEKLFWKCGGYQHRHNL